MCPASVYELPPEILEHILLALHPMDILKMKEVCHLFLDLVASSQHLQYRIDLFSAGLVDDPHTTCDLADRRTRLRKYVDAWKDTEALVRYDIPLKSRMGTFQLHGAGQDIFSAYLEYNMAIYLLRAPSSPSQETTEEWTLELPFRPMNHIVHSQDNLLAVLEQGIDFINIHLLNILDGSPHQLPLQKVIKLDLGDHRYPGAVSTRISGSRVALLFDVMNPTMTRHRRELIAWDWKTGEVIFKHSGDDPDIGGAISRIAQMCFLEGSWLLALSHRSPVPQLLVLNTLLPQQDPRSWRILDLPPLSNPTNTYLIYTQHEKSLAECPEFSVDPAQKVFVIWSQHKQAFVAPVELLIQHMYSARASPRISWDEWGGNLITVHPHPDTRVLQLFDTKLLALRGFVSSLEGWGVEMYDLSRSGRRDVQVREVSEGGNGICRKVLSTPKWLARYQTRDIDPFTTRLVGNKVVSVINRPSLLGGERSLRVWKIGQT